MEEMVGLHRTKSPGSSTISFSLWFTDTARYTLNEFTYWMASFIPLLLCHLADVNKEATDGTAAHVAIYYYFNK